MRKWYGVGMVILVVMLLAKNSLWERQAPTRYWDVRTQRQWQWCSAGMVDGLFGCSGTPGLYDWQQALQYCAQLPGQGWRLPTRNELLSLIDWQKRTPAVPDALSQSTKSNVYWTSTTDAEAPEAAYYVSMFSGHSYPNHKTLQVLVRCIQSPA